MDIIVKKLSEIEHAANAVVLHAEAQKQELEEELQKERDDFDAKLEKHTEKELSDIREGLERQMAQILLRQKRKDASEIEKRQADFEKQHEIYAAEVMKRIIEG